MKPKNILSLAIALPLIAACSTTTHVPTPSEMNAAMREITGQNGRACVRIHDIQGYGALSDSVISVSSKFRKQYIMVTMHRCPAIESGAHMGFKGAFTDFCGGGRDSVHAGEGRCPVQSVYEFDDRDAAFAAHDKAEEMIKKQRGTTEETEE